MSEYLSFEEVLGELNISEEDLKRMVSEGELRAFRDENKMKFRADDVASLKAGGKPSEPTVVFDGGGQAQEGEGTIIDLDSGEIPAVPQETAVPELDFGGGGEAAPAAEAAPAEESSGSGEAGETTGITQEMVFEDSDALKVQPNEESSGQAAETFVDEGSDSGGQTEALAVENEPGAAEAATEEESGAAVTEEEAAEAAPRVRPRAAEAEAAEPAKPAAWVSALLAVATILLALTGYVMVDLIRALSVGDSPSASSMVQKILDTYPGKNKPGVSSQGAH